MFERLFGKKAAPQPSAATTCAPNIKLTERQGQCIFDASETEPIYAENPSHRLAQTPNGTMPHNMKTVDSLVKHGLLKSDGKGGFLLTEAGAAVRRSGSYM